MPRFPLCSRASWWLLVLPILLAGCGGGDIGSPAPTTPTAVTPTAPSPSPSTITVSGTLTDTISGARIGAFSETVAQLPATLTLSASGHLSRQTTVTAQGQTVDLIPTAGFDLEFFRQFARGSLDNPELLPLRVLSQDVSIYVQVEGSSGFAAQVATQLEPVARRIVPDLTGNRLHVARWETGTAVRDLQSGWIIVERSDEESNVCGRALLGALAGHIWLDSNRACNIAATFAHELGHALGFSHVTRPGSLMLPEQAGSNLNDAPTEIERRHAAIAYSRRRGNRDIDVDP